MCTFKFKILKLYCFFFRSCRVDLISISLVIFRWNVILNAGCGHMMRFFLSQLWYRLFTYTFRIGMKKKKIAGLLFVYINRAHIQTRWRTIYERLLIFFYMLHLLSSFMSTIKFIYKNIVIYSHLAWSTTKLFYSGLFRSVKCSVIIIQNEKHICCSHFHAYMQFVYN